MKRTFKKVLASMLALSMLFTSSGMTTLAADVEEDAPVEEAVEEPAQEEPAEEPAIATYSAPAVEEQKETEPAAAESAPAEEKSEAQDTSEAKESAKADDSAKTEAPAETKDSGTEAKTDDSAEKADSASADSDAKEEAAEDDEEEDEVTLIDQKLTATVKSGNAGIETMSASGAKITLEGKMPEGATVKAEPVDVEIEGIAILAAYDITIYDADGNEFEPEEGTIRVHIENAAIREAQKEDNDLFVYHMKTKNAEPEKVQVKEAEDGAVEFDAKEFSIYIVGEDEELYETDGETPHYVYTVNFYDEVKGEQTLLSTQVVSPGEKLEQPATPDKEHYTFDGWYTGENGTGEKYLDLTTDSLPEGITEDTEVDLYAHYIEIYYVYFMATTYAEKDTVDEVTVFHTEAYNPGDELSTAQAEQLYLAEGYLYSYENDDGSVTTQAVTAWLDAEGNEYKTGDVVTGHLELYPVVEEATWIYFDVNGKNTSVDPIYVLASQNTVGTLPEAECEGYTFDGWYTQAEGGTQVTSNTQINSLTKNDDGSVTLYAHWTADTVSYTINIWLQKATDGQKGLDNKEIQSGETYEDYIGYYDIGETIHVSASQSSLRSDQELTSSSTSSIYNWSTYTGYATTSDSDSMYYGFEYSNTEAQTRTLNDLNGKVVASDGSTIINIFYNRITVTWTFYEQTSSSNWRDNNIWGTLIGLYDTNLLPENGSDAAGTIKTGWTLYTSTSMGRTTTYNWVVCYGNNYSSSATIATFETRFRFYSSNNAANARFYYSSQSGSNKIYFYKEVTNEATQVNENSDKAKEASDNGALYTKTVSKTVNGQTTSALYVYDTMITMSGTLTASDKYPGYYVVGYNTSPTSSSSSMTSLSAGEDIGSSFSGTSNNTCIYNDAYEYTITFISSDKNIGIDTAGGYIDGGNSATYTYKYGAALDESIIPTDLDPETWGPNSYSYFTGDWYVDTTMTALFSLPDTMPENNLVAYAKWQVKEITVDFVTNGHADVPESQTFYAANCATDPSPLQNVQEGYTHVGWVDQYGKIFNFATVLYDDTTLTAIWKNENAEGHELTYNLNLNGLGDQEDDSLKYTWHELFAEGSEEELLTVEEVYEYLELTADEDHYAKFVCWNTQPDGSGTNYYPEDEIVFADQAITLYAIWAIENESTLHLDYNYPEGETSDTEYEDKDITGDNLTSIDLDEVSDIHTGDTITVAGVTYRFEGWTANTVTTAETATKDSVEIDADATVAVDNLSTNDANTLHAVWVAIYTITVTKELVDPSNSYPNVDTDSFSFTYSVADGETQTVENIVNGGTFTISDVDNGDTVVISETNVDSSIYTTSYSGATTVVSGEGTEGTYTFIMDSGSTEITVTNTTISHKLYVSKVWLDADGQTETGVSHDAVSVQVYEDEKEVGEKLSLGSGNDWTASMEFVFDSNATYTVTEDAVEGYTSAVSGPTTDADGDMSFTVTNTAIPTTTVTATKVWSDNNDQDGKRDSYGLTLTGTVGEETVYTDTQTLEKDTLTYIWEDLYTTDSNGNEISYSVSETTVPEGYAGGVSGNVTDGFTVTNIHTPETTTVSGTKTWDDSNNADDDRPDSITIRLYANGEAVKDESGEDVTATVTANDNWTFSFEGLDKYAEGQEIQYTVTEDALYHYSTSYSTGDGTYIVTNTHASGKTSITVQKVWSDDSNRDGVRPESVTIDLMADGEQAVDAQGEEIKLTLSGEGDVWTGTFENLDIYEGDETQAIEYSIVEEGVQNGKIGENGEYGSVVAGNATEGYTITNTYTPESADDISVTKVWDDNDDQDGKRDSYSLTLTGTIEGETEPVYTDTQTFDKETLSYTWTGLYKNYNGKEITYSVSESTVPDGYTASVERSDETKSYTVTNTHTPEKISVAGTKTWDDEENADGIRPDSITIHLYTGEEETDSKEVTADADGNWTWSFDNLDKYANGVEIQYSITEDPINYYETTYSAEGYDVTNTHTPGQTYINYSKEWDDDSNRDQVRPESVTIDLMADGVKVDEYTLTGDENKWDGTFTNLVAYDGTTAIEYTIAEEGVDSEGKIADGKYESNITGDASNGYTITNTYTPESADDITATKVWDDSNDQDGKRDSYSLTLTGTVGEATVYTDTQTLDKETLTYTWENLYKNYEGQEITYSVSESTMPEGYEASVEWDEETESYIVTNSYTPKTVDVEGSKTWVDEGDPDEKPASITIHLLADGAEINSATVTADNDGKWAWSFTNLPKYRDGGVEIVYTITEDAVGNYTTTYDEDTYDVTNTYNPEKTTVTITKDWDDDSDRDGKRPEDVTVTLTGTNGFSQEITLNDEDDNNWMATVDVPMYDNDGSTVTYSVTEETVTGYKDPVITSTDGYNFTVTNSYTPELINKTGTITVEKVWDDADDQDGIRPENVTVTLYADEDVAQVFTLGETNSWTDSVSGMYKYANGGQEIAYSVTEAEIEISEGHATGYTTNITGGADEEHEYTFTVTNTHETEVYGEDGTLTVNKVWNDDGNRDGLETDFIIVQLEIDQETTGQTVTLNEENEWTDSFTDLPKYADGEEINYSVEETEVPDGYTATYTQNGDDWTITNTHEDYLVSELIITKEWDDADNQDGIRPDSIVVELQIDGNTVTDVNGNSWTATLTNEDVDADGNWTITVDDHPVYVDENGTEISYTLHEDTVTEGYESTDGTVEITTDDEGNYIGTATITNTHTPETINVTGSKTWVDEGDPDEKPESITIHLLADGTEIDSVTVTEGDEWAWSFTDLPKYRDGGTEIVYTITEDAIGNYTTEINGYNVTNTYNPEETTVTITKEWDDDSNRDGKRPEEVTVTLTGTNGFSQEITLNDENSWMATVNVPMYPNSGRGVLVTYTVTENQVDEYDEPVITTDNGYDFTVTNTYTPELINETGTVTVKKVWDDADDQDGIRPDSVEVTLSAVDSDGETVALPDNVEATQTITAGDENDWTVTYDGLYKYANGGKEITYSVSESEIALPEGHEGESGYTPTITGGADEENEYTFIVTNTHEPEVYGEDGTLTVTKVWNDDGNRDGLETDSITVQLEIDQETTGQTVTLNEDNEWTASFTDLPKYADGEEIDYSVEETEVPDGYTATYTQFGDDWTITNTHEDYLVSELTLTKVWEDTDDQDGIRPDSIVVELQIDGETAKDADGNNWTATLTKDDVDADGNWTITVDDHPVFLDANGQQISYKVHEDNVTEGYAADDGTVTITETTDTEGNTVYTGEATITNIHTPAKVDVEGTKTWDDSDDADEDRPSEITIRLYAGGTAIDSQTVTADDGWTWSFEDLDKYENGVEIEYTITEDAIYHYSTTYDGYDVTNTHTPGQTSVTVTKIWDDVSDHDGVRPESVTIDLLADGKPIEDIEPLTLSGDGDVWVGSFTGLDIYNGETPIEYTIVEEGVGDDEQLGEDYKSHIDGNAETGFIITNRLDVTDWTVEKTLTNKGSGEDDAFKLGETAEFTITVTNIGNTDIDSIDITELLDGAVFTEGDGYKLNEEKTVATIEGLAAGDSVELYAAYTIEEKDLGTDLENSVTTSDGDPDDPEPGDKTPIPTEDPEAHLTVTKTTTSEPENGETYALGEEITYEITVENDGNRTVENITVTDELTGDEWTIESLAPGETWTGTATHEVDEDDILAGSVVNEATVTAKDPDDPDSDVPNTPGTDEEETEEKNGHITVTKEVTSEPANGETYAYDEEITYKITVTNDGNLTITDITVTDELTGDEWTIDSLAPGASEEFDASYKVTMEDVNSGSVTNVATVEGTSPDPDVPDVPSEPGEAVTPIDPIYFFPLDEEIVPGADDEASPGTWVTRESVNEYDAIEIEMSTTLPVVSGERLTAEEFSMTFHNQLETPYLVLDELDSDFTVDINGTSIDHQYYEIDTTQANRLLQFFSISDGCTFHVNVNLSALYRDEVISDEDLGTGTVRVFFYADLETEDVNSSYTSTAWYDVAADGTVLYTSDPVTVDVYTFEIIVNAYDKETGAPLAGAEYGLYYQDNDEPVSRNGAPYIVTTDENGQGMFVGIAEGDYYVKEIVKPDEYKSITEPVTVTLAGDEESEHIFEVEFPYELADPTKTADVETAGVGDEITYTITYYNNYEEPATVTITDTLDKGVDFVSASEPYDYDEESRTVTWTIEDAAPEEEGSVQLTVQVNKNAADSTLENTAGVQVGNEAEVSTNTVGIPVEPEAGPEKSANVEAGEYVKVGDEIIYTITYFNDNSDTATVTITDTLADGVDFESATDDGVYDEVSRTVTWTIEAAAYEKGSVQLTVKVNEDAEAGSTLENTAEVQVEGEDPESSNTVDIPIEPEIPTNPDTPQDPTKTSNVKAGASVTVGDEIIYTITYYNHNEDPTDVVIVDTLDAGLDFVSATEGGVYDQDAHAVTWTIADAPHGEGSVTLTLKANETAGKGGSVKNTASVKIGDDEAKETNTVGISVKEQSSGGTTGGTTGTGAPKTADTNRMDLWLLLLVCSAGVAVGAYRRRYKRS